MWRTQSPEADEEHVEGLTTEELPLGGGGGPSFVRRDDAKWMEVATSGQRITQMRQGQNLANGNTASHFRNILERRQKQVSLHKFLVRKCEKRPRAKTPESVLPAVVMEGL